MAKDVFLTKLGKFISEIETNRAESKLGNAISMPMYLNTEDIKIIEKYAKGLALQKSTVVSFLIKVAISELESINAIDEIMK